MRLSIVTHCYAKMIPEFATHLHAQLWSLRLFECKHERDIYVYCTEDDERVNRIVDFHQKDLDILRVQLPPELLFRRSIGRNSAALSQKSDVVWFTDADHYFGRDCLNHTLEHWETRPEGTLMIWPGKLFIHKDHETGDAFTASLANMDMRLPVVIDNGEFVSKKYTRAIGGVQIACGRYCRDYGYLRHSKKYQQPRQDGVPFGDFRDDRAFRTHLGIHGKIYRVPVINGLYRIRHKRTSYQ